MSKLLQRLKRTVPAVNGAGAVVDMLANPDGIGAADEIERLREVLTAIRIEIAADHLGVLEAIENIISGALEENSMSDLYVGPFPIDMTLAEARGEIMLEIAAADDEHRKWERRWNVLLQLHGHDRHRADDDGRWCLRDFIDYAGAACGFIRREPKA